MNVLRADAGGEEPRSERSGPQLLFVPSEIRFASSERGTVTCSPDCEMLQGEGSGLHFVLADDEDVV